VECCGKRDAALRLGGPSVPDKKLPPETEEWYNLWTARCGLHNPTLLRRTFAATQNMENHKPHAEDISIVGQSRLQRAPFSGHFPRAEGPLHILHMDVFQPRWNELPHTAEGVVLTMRYALVIVDDYSRFSRTYFCKKKTELPGLLRLFCEEMGLKRLHAAQFYLHSRLHPHAHVDGDSVLTAAEVMAVFTEIGLTASVTSAPGCPSDNAIAERMIQTLSTDARLRLLASHIPLRFWFYAFWHACCTRNMMASRPCRIGVTGDVVYLTPFQLFFGFMPDLRRLVAFGSPCLYLREGVEDSTRGKFEPPGKPGFVLGYGGDGIQWQGRVRYVLGYLILDANKRSLYWARTVAIDERKVLEAYAGTSVVEGGCGPTATTEEARGRFTGEAPQLRGYGEAAAKRRPGEGWPPSQGHSQMGPQNPETRSGTFWQEGSDQPVVPERSGNRSATDDEDEEPHVLLDAPDGMAYAEPSHNEYYTLQVSENGEEMHTVLLDGGALARDLGQDLDGMRLDPFPEADAELDLRWDPMRRDRAVRQGTRRPSIPVARAGVDAHIEQVYILTASIRKFFNGEEVHVPLSYEEAMSSPQAAQWQRAIDDQIEQYIKMGAFELQLVPEDSKLIKAKWVFDAKSENPLGHVDRWRARAVVGGYSQIYGIHFTDTFAPTVRQEQVRMMLAMIAKHMGEAGHSLRQNDEVKIVAKLDVKEAYLNAVLPEEERALVRPMERYPLSNSVVPQGYKFALVTLRAIPGMRQSGRTWWLELRTTLMESGWEVCGCAACLYKLRLPRGGFLFLGIFVDDGLLFQTARDDGAIRRALEMLTTKYRVTLDYEIGRFLGPRVCHSPQGIFLHMAKYIVDLGTRFGIIKYRASSPEARNSTALHADDELVTDQKTEFQALVGSLIFCMTTVRMDIAHAVGVLTARMSAPRNRDWEDALKCLAYLCDTPGRGILFPYEVSGNGLECYVDSDWAGDLVRRRSRSGYVVTYNGAPVSWYSGLQPIIAQSSTEAEYVAAAHAASEVQYLVNLLDFFECPAQGSVPMYEDNQGTVDWIENPVQHRKSKHMELKWHYVRHLLQQGVIRIIKVGTEYQLADMFTKALPVASFLKLVNALMANVSFDELDQATTASTASGGVSYRSLRS